jgi:hypothetical protein
MTHGELISEIYAHLGKEKRNEYYYQNTLLNKLLVGVHSVNTTTALSQVRIGKSIADLVMINGEAVAYEIKSELDNYGRLEDQLRDYYQAFSKVVVVVPEYAFEKVKQVLSELNATYKAVGIYTITNNNTLSKGSRIKPVHNYSLLAHSALFKLLRKSEYERVLLAHFGKLPKCDQVFYFRVCLEHFKEIPLLTAQKLTFGELKKRNRITKESFASVTEELRSVVYFSKLSKQLPALKQMLQTQYRR